jgi:glycosyltransferase involved in cell wall biosynthesis
MHTKPVLAFVGRLVTTKGVRVLLEAAQFLRQQGRSLEFLILGDGPERSALEALARQWQLGSQVQFLGRVPQPQLSEILATADFVVIPSLGGEVFGMVVAENMLRGIPVLASNLGAFVEVLGASGPTFRTGDSSDLALQIAHLLDDSASSHRMSESGHRRVVELFNVDRMIEGHAKIYRRLASAKVHNN